MAGSIATTDAYATSRRQRKKIEMLFAHLKGILRLDRLRLRGPNGLPLSTLLTARLLANGGRAFGILQDLRPSPRDRE